MGDGQIQFIDPVAGKWYWYRFGAGVHQGRCLAVGSGRWLVISQWSWMPFNSLSTCLLPSEQLIAECEDPRLTARLRRWLSRRANAQEPKR